MNYIEKYSSHFKQTVNHSNQSEDKIIKGTCQRQGLNRSVSLFLNNFYQLEVESPLVRNSKTFSTNQQKKVKQNNKISYVLKKQLIKHKSINIFRKFKKQNLLKKKKNNISKTSLIESIKSFPNSSVFINGINLNDLINFFFVKCQVYNFTDIELKGMLFINNIQKNTKHHIFNGQNSGINQQIVQELQKLLLKYTDCFSRLCLSGNRIGDKGIKNIIKIIEHNCNMFYLDLSNNEIKQQGFKLFFQYLNSNQSIFYLDLSNYSYENRNQFKGLTQFSFRGKNEVLQILKLSNIKLSLQGFRQIIKYINEKQMIQLDVSDNYIGGKIIDIILQKKELNIQSLNLAKQFIIIRNKIGNHAFAKLNKIFKFTKFRLSSLNISENQITSFGMAKFMSVINIPQIFTCIKLNCNNFRNQSFRIIQNFLTKSKINKLQLQNCNLNSQSLIALKSLTITQLNLNRNPLKLKGQNYLSMLLISNKNLKKLGISSCDVFDQQLQALIQQKKKVFSDLQQLDLSNNYLSNKSFTYLLILVNLIPSIIALNLSFNPIYFSNVQIIMKCMNLLLQEIKQNFKERRQKIYPQLIRQYNKFNHFLKENNIFQIQKKIIQGKQKQSFLQLQIHQCTNSLQVKKQIALITKNKKIAKIQFLQSQSLLKNELNKINKQILQSEIEKMKIMKSYQNKINEIRETIKIEKELCFKFKRSKMGIIQKLIKYPKKHFKSFNSKISKSQINI